MKEEISLVWTGNKSFAYHYPITLTPRQQEVLLLLCEGLTNKSISRRLRVSDATVKTHVASVLCNFNVSTRLEAVTQAFKLGLVRPEHAEAVLGHDRNAGVLRQSSSMSGAASN